MSTNITSPVDVGSSAFTPLSTMDIASAGSAGVAIGSYAGANAAPADGLIVSGKVGIGTASPNTAISVLVPFSHTGDLGTIISAQAGSTSVAAIGTDVDNVTTGATSLTFDTLVGNNGLTEKMRITGSGNVGIGTTSPAQPLDVTGNVHISSLAAGGIVISTSGVLGITPAAGVDTTAIHTGATAGGDLTGTYPNPTLAAIGSATGPIGSATTTPVVTIDAKGRVTALTAATISGTSPGGAASGDLSGSYPGPSVIGIQGRSVSSAAPSVGQVLRWTPNASPLWRPSATGFVYPEDFGAGGAGTTDDSAAIAAAISACTGGMTVILTGKYAIGTTTVNFSCPVWSTSASQIIPYGTNANGITISGGASMTFGYIGGFSAYAIKLIASPARVDVYQLQGSSSGQTGIGILCTTGAATCDIQVQFMTNFVSCIAFQNGTSADGLQGLRISVSFADDNLYGLNFDGSDNCDSNLIRFGSWDFDIPSGASTGSVWYNSNSSGLNNALANCQLDIEDWFGNGASGGTVGNNAIALGAFVGCCFGIGNAAGSGTYAWDFFNISGNGSGNNSVTQRRRSSLGAGITANWQTATASRSSFITIVWYTGGLYCTGTWSGGTIAPGASIKMYVYTPFTAAHLGASWAFWVSGPLPTSNSMLTGAQGGGLVCTQIYDNSSAGASQTEELILIWTNTSSATVANNTVISFNLFAF